MQLIKDAKSILNKKNQFNLELLKSALDFSIVSVLITDNRLPDNPIIYCNKSFEKITGYSCSEVLGVNCRFLQGNKPDPEAVSQIRNALSTGEDIIIEIKNYKKDSTPFWNELHISPVKDPAGTITHFIGIQLDITERKIQPQIKPAVRSPEDKTSFIKRLKLLLPRF